MIRELTTFAGIIFHFIRDYSDFTRLVSFKVHKTRVTRRKNHVEKQLGKKIYSLTTQNKANSENRHLVFSIFKKKQENNGVGDTDFVFIPITIYLE